MLNFRQQEFARHYAHGLCASQAARTAGYAASTAETNAARLLRSPLVCSLILRHRNQSVYVEDGEMLQAMERLRTLIDSPNEHVALSAIRLLAQIQHRQLAASTVQPAQDPAVFVHPEQEPIPDSDDCPTIDQTQDTVDQAFEDTPRQDRPLPDTDTLPDGRPAFDLYLKRLITPRPLTQILPAADTPYQTQPKAPEPDDGFFRI